MNQDEWFYTHLKPNTLKDKDLFVQATSDIEGSFTGRVDILTSGLHRFFLESSKLIRNAIKLYEEGVFDAAFYSTRSALELSRIVAYFSHKDDPKDSEMYKNWTTGGKFPFDSAIKKELEKSSGVYIEVCEALPDFFDDQKKRLASAQKYIHKQGFKTFYERGLNSSDKEKKRLELIDQEFYLFIKNALIEIALLRLCIDPFPILLADKKVMYKIHFESMTGPFGDSFLNEIIGKDKIEKYRSTEFYKSHLDYFRDNEELSEVVHVLINDQFYHRESWPAVQSQLHLLSTKDITAVSIFNSSSKIAKIYVQGGWTWYFSDVSSIRKGMGFSSEVLLNVKNADEKINFKYDEAYLSHFEFEDDDLWIEHNELLDKIDLSKIKEIIKSVGA